jgi:dihydrofolate reductase
MGIVTTQHSSSIDGFIADRQGRSDSLHDWLRAGGQHSRVNPNFAMHPVNARFFDEGVGRCGAVIAGRRTYDVSDGWAVPARCATGRFLLSPAARPMKSRWPIRLIHS